MKSSTKSTLTKYISETKKHWFLFCVVAISVVGASVFRALTPLFVRDLLNILASSEADKLPGLYHTLTLIAILEACQWVCWRINTFTNTFFEATVLADLANSCFAYLHRHSFGFFNSNFVGSLVKRVNYFTRAFETIADRVIWNILPLIVDFAIIITVLFRISHLLGYIVIGWTVVFMIINAIFTKYKLKHDLARSESETKATALLADTITNQSNVKLFVGRRREEDRFKKANELVRKLRIISWNWGNWFEAIQGFLMAGLNIGIFYFAIRLSEAGRITVGDFVLLQAYLIMIFDRVWDFGRLVRDLFTNIADANEMTVILDTPHEITDVARAKELNLEKGRIEFKNVDFYYHETRKIFSKFNLTIAAGEKIALVGPSGAGKSTVIKLLLRQHNVTAGTITIDGQPIDRVTQESLWANISLVPQDPILFHRSLMENIRYGKPDASDEEVIAAAKLAHCDEFIDSFPERYKTFVGERGVKLSGGERQRVAIARAILRNSPILVLDEATSSLDSESEHLIQDALKTLMQNKTVIVIAHRLSTIMTMDRIVVVNHGAVVEQGAHQELLKNPSGLYSQLWKRQAGGFMTDEPAQTSSEVLYKEPSNLMPEAA